MYHLAPGRVCALGVAVMVLALAGCGDETGDAQDPARDDGSAGSASGSDSATDGPAGWPACEEVWVAGQTLPRRYRGCVEGDAQVKADKVSCASGQTLVTYDDRFYAVTGGPVNESDGSLQSDSEYVAARQSCLG